MKKRLLSILLVLLMALTLLPLGALADENSKCGESLTWELTAGILTIKGTGDMYDYSSADPAPWSAKNNDISEITVSEGVTSIGNNAFHSCNAESVDLQGTSLVSIGKNAFSRCTMLMSIFIPESVQSIGSEAFSLCEGLSMVELPTTLTIIPDGIFTDCALLESITIPDTVTEIGANAFLRCKVFSLETLPGGIKSIGAAAFENCGSIENLELPKTLESIGEAAFGGTIIDKASFDGTLEKWAAIGGDGCGIARDKMDFLEHICDFSGWEYDTQKHTGSRAPAEKHKTKGNTRATAIPAPSAALRCRKPWAAEASTAV